MSVITGKYRLETNDNMDDYFAKVGMPYLVRKMVLLTTPTMDVEEPAEEGQKWHFVMHETTKSLESHFVLGQEFDEPFSMGIIKTVVTRPSDNVLVFQSQTKYGEITRTMTFSQEGCKLHYHNPSVDAKGTRIFKRQ